MIQLSFPDLLCKAEAEGLSTEKKPLCERTTQNNSVVFPVWGRCSLRFEELLTGRSCCTNSEYVCIPVMWCVSLS